MCRGRAWKLNNKQQRPALTYYRSEGGQVLRLVLKTEGGGVLRQEVGPGDGAVPVRHRGRFQASLRWTRDGLENTEIDGDLHHGGMGRYSRYVVYMWVW